MFFALTDMTTLVLADVNFNQTILNLVKVFASFVGGFAALSFLYAGYLWMTAGDNVHQETAAKKALASAIIGTIIVLGAITLSNLVTSALAQ